MCALAAGWNGLVLDLRERDLLDNRELAVLSFEQLQLTHSQKGHLRNLPHVGQLGLTSVLPARWGLLNQGGDALQSFTDLTWSADCCVVYRVQRLAWACSALSHKASKQQEAVGGVPALLHAACRCFMAGAVPELASGHVCSAHHAWVGRMAWGWLLWVVWQTGLLYNGNATEVRVVDTPVA